jgi:1,4-alpha-glucan branching enzyme
VQPALASAAPAAVPKPLLLSLDWLAAFSRGEITDPAEFIGAHPFERDGQIGVRFAVWAPHARRVSVVGDFNQWDGNRNVLDWQGYGVWATEVMGLKPGTLYKYELIGPDGHMQPLKADPYAFAAEMRPATASKVAGPVRYRFEDAAWMESRRGKHGQNAPICIYEMHLGSWRRSKERSGSFLSYEEIGDLLVPYLTDLGFTHVQFMPVSEFPFDGSWGYQPTGMYAPTSRFGTPEQFARLVDRLHQAGIGVLLDFVPAHFPVDGHGLGKFDGSPAYEHWDMRRGFHPDWNTLIYDFGRPEVQSFLIGSARYWLDRLHIDGLRVDAVSSMLYLDYSRKHGEWEANIYGGNTNLEAVNLIKRMNETVYSVDDGLMMVAEESTAWQGVSKPTYLGGLGFGYKWNMGWMHDTLEYMKRDPIHRCHHHGEMTFGLVYAWSENFILALSHDEVVHGKGSLLAKMPGDTWQRFANLRAYYAFMWAHPGKKLIFMGAEFAQWNEWNHDASLDWHLLSEDGHAGVQRLIKSLNLGYRYTPALYEQDCVPEGFSWVQGDVAAISVYAFLRWDHARKQPLLSISNFTPVPRANYRVGVPFAGNWNIVLNTDARTFGGESAAKAVSVRAEAVPFNDQPYSVVLDLPALAGLWLTRG